MATKPLKSIKFPGLTDLYTVPQVDNTLTESGGAADAKVVGDALATKAEQDGTYENLTAGNAQQLESTVYTEDREPYSFRTTGGSADVGNRAYSEAIVGGSVVWNQLAAADTEGWSNDNVSHSVTDGSITITSTTDSTATKFRYLTGLPQNHVILGCASVSGDGTNDAWFGLCAANGGSYVSTEHVTEAGFQFVSFIGKANSDSYYAAIRLANDAPVDAYATFKNIQLFDLTQMFGTAVANYIYSLETATAGAGVVYFKNLFPETYYNYNAGELLSVNVSAKETVGFNLFDISNAVADSKFNFDGTIVTASGYTRSEYIRCIPETEYCLTIKGIAGTSYEYGAYYFDSSYTLVGANMWQSSGQTAGAEIVNTYTTPLNAVYMGFNCLTADAANLNANIAWSGYRNGEYEQYVKHTYPLDSSLTLRGIPKLDSDNKLYFDGDEYLPDGTVNRRYGVVDLGSLSWTREAMGTKYRFHSSIVAGMKSQTDKNILCPKYVLDISPIYNSATDKIICNYTRTLFVVDNDYTDAATFKAAMSGVYLVYEKATSTTETAEAYTTPQIVDDFGMERFVDYAESQGTRDVAIPVGHVTDYPVNLRDKLQHLPFPADDNGDYVIRQTDRNMSLVSVTLPSVVTISDRGAVITAADNTRYVCGELDTLTLTPVASGVTDVVFTSGTTATVVTLPDTVKFPEGTFTAEADRTYEINILDGIYGTVAEWI